MTVNAERSPRIFRYIVAYDYGSAPNPFDGYCTLAVCKPRIRRTAKVGDWVIGFQTGKTKRVTYAMEVGESLSFSEYWHDPRFKSRKPDNKLVPDDNIYRPLRADALEPSDFVWVESRTHDDASRQKDVGGQRVLIAKRFWYFGREAPVIDSRLDHLVPVTQGHCVDVHRKPSDLPILIGWLSRFDEGAHALPLGGVWTEAHLKLLKRTGQLPQVPIAAPLSPKRSNTSRKCG